MMRGTFRSVAPAALLLVGLAATSASAVDEATRRLVFSDDWRERWDACAPLGREDTAEAARLLVRLLKDEDSQVRDAAVRECGQLHAEGAGAVLIGALGQGTPLTRRNVAAALGRTRLKSGVEALGKAARGDPDAAVRAEAVDALHWFGHDPRALPICVDAVRDRDPLVRATAAFAASKQRENSGRDVVLAAFRDAHEGVRAAALGSLWGADVRVALAEAANDASWRVRTQCATAALGTRSVEGMDVLMKLVGDPRGRVAATAAHALRLLTQKDFGRDAEVWGAWWTQNRAKWTAPKGDLSDPRTSDGPGTRARFMGVEVEGEGTAFVLDASASMNEPASGGGTRADLVRGELTATLAALPDGHRVNVVYFADGVRTAFERALPLSSSTRTTLAKFLRGQSPEGETNFYAGVSRALADDGVDAICVLSDGAPTRGEVCSSSRVRELVERTNRLRRVTIHTVGIASGTADDRDFLRGLADDNGGRCVLR